MSASSGQVGHGHPHIDRRGLARARLVVEQIDAQPTLLNIAHENLAKWRKSRGGTLTAAHQEWERILERPWEEVRAILVEESDEGQRLRSSNPFAGIVTEEERLAIIARYPAT